MDVVCCWQQIIDNNNNNNSSVSICFVVVLFVGCNLIDTFLFFFAAQENLNRVIIVVTIGN